MYHLRLMELLPQALVVGCFAAVQPTPGPVVTPDKLNRIWAEVAPRQGYRQLQLGPDGSSAVFLGARPDDGAAIQLPLLQVRSAVQIDVMHSVDDAQSVLKTVGTVLGIAQFFNLGIKLVYNSPAPDNDARSFIMHRLALREEGDLETLRRGGDLWSGVKYGINSVDGSAFTLSIEPMLADNRFVFIDLDAQFPGMLGLDSIKDRGRDVEQYAIGSMKSFLDRAESGA